MKHRPLFTCDVLEILVGARIISMLLHGWDEEKKSAWVRLSSAWLSNEKRNMLEERCPEP